MTPAINGTEERLDVVIALLRELLAQSRLVDVVDVTTHSTGELKPAAAKKKR